MLDIEDLEYLITLLERETTTYHGIVEAARATNAYTKLKMSINELAGGEQERNKKSIIDEHEKGKKGKKVKEE